MGRKLNEAGYTIGNISCQSKSSADKAQRFIGAGTTSEPEEGPRRSALSSTIIIIGTPDRSISSVDVRLAPHLHKGHIILHLSGALPSSRLKHCRDRQAAIGSMHPLQSFADPEATLEILAGSTFACEGDERAVVAGFEIAQAVGGHPIRIQTESKSIYHAAAAAASNFMIAPLLLALDLMKAAGLDHETGLQALSPLITGTARNAVRIGVPDALTGPIERNELLVIQGHLQSIAKDCPDCLPSYRALARLTVDVAIRKGRLSEAEAAKLITLIAADISDIP